MDEASIRAHAIGNHVPFNLDDIPAGFRPEQRQQWVITRVQNWVHDMHRRGRPRTKRLLSGLEHRGGRYRPRSAVQGLQTNGCSICADLGFMALNHRADHHANEMDPGFDTMLKMFNSKYKALLRREFVKGQPPSLGGLPMEELSPIKYWPTRAQMRWLKTFEEMSMTPGAQDDSVVSSTRNGALLQSVSSARRGAAGAHAGEADGTVPVGAQGASSTEPPATSSQAPGAASSNDPVRGMQPPLPPASPSRQAGVAVPASIRNLIRTYAQQSQSLKQVWYDKTRQCTARPPPGPVGAWTAPDTSLYSRLLDLCHNGTSEEKNFLANNGRQWRIGPSHDDADGNIDINFGAYTMQQMVARFVYMFFELPPRSSRASFTHLPLCIHHSKWGIVTFLERAEEYVISRGMKPLFQIRHEVLGEVKQTGPDTQFERLVPPADDAPGQGADATGGPAPATGAGRGRGSRGRGRGTGSTPPVAADVSNSISQMQSLLLQQQQAQQQAHQNMMQMMQMAALSSMFGRVSGPTGTIGSAAAAGAASSAAAGAGAATSTSGAGGPVVSPAVATQASAAMVTASAGAVAPVAAAAAASSASMFGRVSGPTVTIGSAAAAGAAAGAASSAAAGAGAATSTGGPVAASAAASSAVDGAPVPASASASSTTNRHSRSMVRPTSITGLPQRVVAQEATSRGRGRGRGRGGTRQ